MTPTAGQPGSYPFDQVAVRFSLLGTTAVTWRLSPRLRDPAPYRFGLQFAYAQDPTDADWADVGLEAEDAPLLVDTTPRLYGKTTEAYYRVRLATAAAVYVSAPAGCLTGQDYRDWRIARNIIRQEAKRARLTSVEGFLLKEKRYGPPCPVCLDPATELVTNSHCPSCYGVGRLGGFLAAVPAVCDLGLDSGEELQDNQTAGTTKESVVLGRFAGQPDLNSNDIFVAARSDRRWRIGKVDEKASVKGQVLVEEAELRFLPYRDVAYQVPVHG